MESNYYEVLGVKASAKDEEIKHAFKSLAKVYHPDKNPGNKTYEEQFKKINEAYQVLSDNSKRFFYDIKLESRNAPHRAEAAPTPPPPAPPKYSTRKKQVPKKEIRLVEKKVWILTIAGIVLFIIGAFFLYNFMNRYTANNLYEEGLELEDNKVYIGAMEKYSEAIGYDKTFASAYTHRALLRVLHLGDFNGGLYDLKQAIAYTKIPSAQLFYYRGKVYNRIGKYKEAMKDFDLAIATDPKFDSAYFSKAEIENSIQHNYALAALHYSKAIEINPRFSFAYFGKGLVQQTLRSNNEAIENFNKAIELRKSEGLWYFHRGLSKLALKKKSQACADFKIALGMGIEPAEKEIRKSCR